MKRHWRMPLYAVVVAATLVGFLAGGHLAATSLIEAQRSRQLGELNALVLRRSEAAVDYAAATLDELAARGPMSCDASALQTVRLHVYRRGAVKDIRAVRRDGAVICSAYSETLEFDRSWVDRDDMLPARDPHLRLFRVEQFFGVALGVLRDIDDDNALVAVLGVNASFFDVMPGALRRFSDVSLTLADGSGIAHSSPDIASLPEAAVVSLTARSERYPLTTTIRVERTAYELWNRDAYLPIMILTAALGLAFGALLARLWVRPRSLLAELDRGLARCEFKPYLQPVLDLGSGRVIGAEVLARWVRADGSVVPPSRFIPLAEESGRIGALTWQILAAALHELRGHLARDKAFKVSVNIGPRHFLSPGFAEDLRRVVRMARVSPRQIALELTEREAFDDLGQAAGVVAAMRAYGFKVAIDDVGVGHSGLSHIQRLGANVLKIDKFFIDCIDRDAAANTVVAMLVRLARELDMSVVAEGIEKQEQIAALLSCGVTQGQGYLFCPPLPAARFIEFLQSKDSDATAAEGRRDVVRAA